MKYNLLFNISTIGAMTVYSKATHMVFFCSSSHYAFFALQFICNKMTSSGTINKLNLWEAISICDEFAISRRVDSDNFIESLITIK